MVYLIAGTLAYSTQANRNTVLTNVNNALASFDVTNVASAFAAGVNTSGTTALTISIEVPDDQVEAVRAALLTARTSATRASTGWYLSVVKR